MLHINDLLFAAAMAAKMMLKLELMEMCDKGQADIFRYVSAMNKWQGT